MEIHIKDDWTGLERAQIVIPVQRPLFLIQAEPELWD